MVGHIKNEDNGCMGMSKFCLNQITKPWWMMPKTQQCSTPAIIAAGTAVKGRNKTQIVKVEQTHTGDISYHH